MSGLLKRKFVEVEEDQCYSSSSPSSLSSSAYSGWDSDSESCYSDTLDSTPSNPSSPASPSTTSILKKAKRPRRGNVQFDQVTVFFFPRCQGFTSVPSRGGCTLGMVQTHSAQQRYTISEFAIEQQHLRLGKLKNRMKEEKLEALRQKLTKNGTQESEEAKQLTVDDISEDELDLSGVNLDSFLHPYPSRRRHNILKAAGVKKIDREEKRQLHQLRMSREDCGCNCQGFCEPETCSCSLAGIKCQMDHSSFPCGCTKDGCGNTKGRVEFNPGRVQTHYIHTIMKLELEKRLEEHTPNPATPPKTLADTSGFHFSSELAAAGENSCSSDMTDSSNSSSQSEDSETLGQGESPGVDESGVELAEILSFSDTDGEEFQARRRPWNEPLGYGLFSTLEHQRDWEGIESRVGSIPNTPSPGIDGSSSYMDLSLSSESDLEFFEGFPCLGQSSLYNSLKDYEHLDNFFHFQLPNFPQANDPGTGILESLIGLSESVPEPQTTFTDNQMLEEDMKLSVMEFVKV